MRKNKKGSDPCLILCGMRISDLQQAMKEEPSDRGLSFSEVAGFLDKERLEILNGRRTEKEKLRALASGLLLRLAQENGYDTPEGIQDPCEVWGRLQKAGPAPECPYGKGPQGKPYFADGTLPKFNITHSGDYVLLALSDAEVGIDLQEHRGLKLQETADRFFSPEEAEALRRAGEEKPALFYRLWTRREAYGKAFGCGVLPVMGKNYLDLLNPELRDVRFTDIFFAPGYSLCICLKADRRIVQK
ncbi:MAG: 4'-phosphopantetheinyl transferase superfamily protein [Lachnospiraceae bacterium]|nr:4'-phosphopantetheinyl transferase superfamily protein [Lachnospiraceae bacterium]